MQIGKTSSKKLGKRPRADKHKGKRTNQQALDRSGDGTLRQGGGKRARKSQPWKHKQATGKQEEDEDASSGDEAPGLATEAAAKTFVPGPQPKSRDEIVSKTLESKIRKRDEDAPDAAASGTVPHKALVEITDPRLMSRILYCNPVSLLTTVVPRAVRVKTSTSVGDARKDAEEEDDAPDTKATADVSANNDQVGSAQEDAGGSGGHGLVQLAEGGSCRNVMVLSWLTPTNNEGGFMCALHKRRFSAECLQARQHFALSIPVAGMEGLVLKVGDVTGKSVDKFKLIDGLEFVEMGSFVRGPPQQQASKKRAVEAPDAGSSNIFAALEGPESGDGDHATVSAREVQERALAGDEAGGVLSAHTCSLCRRPFRGALPPATPCTCLRIFFATARADFAQAGRDFGVRGAGRVPSRQDGGLGRWQAPHRFGADHEGVGPPGLLERQTFHANKGESSCLALLPGLLPLCAHQMRTSPERGGVSFAFLQLKERSKRFHEPSHSELTI
jgi:hypothetical protein